MYEQILSLIIEFVNILHKSKYIKLYQHTPIEIGVLWYNFKNEKRLDFSSQFS